MSDVGGGDQRGPGDYGGPGNPPAWQSPSPPPPGSGWQSPQPPPPPPGSGWQSPTPSGGWQPPPPGSGWQQPGGGWQQPSPQPSWQSAPPPYIPPGQSTGGRASGIAVAALVFGIASFVVLPLIGGIVAIVLGSKARKDSQGPGSGMAQAGLILGIINVVLSLFVAVLVAIGAARISHTHYTDLKAGDCFNPITSASLYRGEVDKVDCSRLHQVEATGQFEATGSTYPGKDGFSAQAHSQCGTLAGQYRGQGSGDVRIVWFYPTKSSWDAGTHTILCGLQNLDGSKRVGSLRGT